MMIVYRKIANKLKKIARLFKLTLNKPIQYMKKNIKDVS